MVPLVGSVILVVLVTVTLVVYAPLSEKLPPVLMLPPRVMV
jgi:hypothetical protein